MSNTTKILIFWFSVGLFAVVTILLAQVLNDRGDAQQSLLKTVTIQAYTQGYLNGQSDAKNGKFSVDYIGKVDTILWLINKK